NERGDAPPRRKAWSANVTQAAADARTAWDAAPVRAKEMPAKWLGYIPLRAAGWPRRRRRSWLRWSRSPARKRGPRRLCEARVDAGRNADEPSRPRFGQPDMQVGSYYGVGQTSRSAAGLQAGPPGQAGRGRPA